MTTKRLYRSDTNKVLCGVLGGVGEYFDIDPTILRLGYIIFALPGFFHAIIAYFIAVIIIPKRVHPVHHEHSEKKE